MSPLPDSRADSHLVHTQAFDGDELFFVCEELGLHGRIRHEEEHDDGEGHRDATAEEKDNLVRVEVRINVTQSIRQQTAELLEGQ